MQAAFWADILVSGGPRARRSLLLESPGRALRETVIGSEMYRGAPGGNMILQQRLGSGLRHGGFFSLSIFLGDL